MSVLPPRLNLRAPYALGLVILCGGLGACTTSSNDEGGVVGEDASLWVDGFRMDHALDSGFFRDIEVTDADRDAQTVQVNDVQVRRDGGQVVRDAETVDANLSDERDATVMGARTEDATPRDIGLPVDSGCEPNCPSEEICNGVDDDLDEMVDERDGIEGDVSPCVDGRSITI